MSDKTAIQHETYWREQIADQLWTEAQRVQLVNDDWQRAAYFRIAAAWILRPTFRRDVNPDYHVDVEGRPE